MPDAGDPLDEPAARSPGSPDRRLKVVTVSDYDWTTGGVEVFVRELHRETEAEFDHCLVSWTSEVPVASATRLMQIEHGDLQALRLVLMSADVVLLMTSFNVRALAWLVADLLDTLLVPVVTVVHTSSHSGGASSLERLQLKQLSRLLSGSAAVVAVSDDVAHAVAGVIDPRGPAVTVIENAARALPRFNTSLRVRGRQLVAFIGRPHPQKGFDQFRSLARDLGGHNLRFVANTVSVVVAGDDGIEYSANLSDQELRRFFDAADLLVAPYLNADGMPLALLEAMSCGVPIIGYDTPGVGSLLRQHHQVVVQQDYGLLLQAVRDWATGRLIAEQPDPTGVATWTDCAARYKQVIRSAWNVSSPQSANLEQSPTIWKGGW